MRQDELRALELLLKEKENEIIPKKAFGFSFSAKPTPKPVPEPAEEKPALENVDGNGNDPIIVVCIIRNDQQQTNALRSHWFFCFLSDRGRRLQPCHSGKS